MDTWLEFCFTDPMINDPPNPAFQGPKVFVSYAWGDDSSQEARQREQVVERLCETVQNEGWRWSVIRQLYVMET